jgi:hypothetical protein
LLYVLNFSRWEIENAFLNAHLMALWTLVGNSCFLHGKSSNMYVHSRNGTKVVAKGV